MGFFVVTRSGLVIPCMMWSQKQTVKAASTWAGVTRLSNEWPVTSAKLNRMTGKHLADVLKTLSPFRKKQGDHELESWEKLLRGKQQMTW